MTLSKEQLKRVTSAKRAVVDSKLAIFNLRLEALAQAGDGPAVLDLIDESVMDTINNCGCNVQCGALREQIGSISATQPGR